MEKNMITVWWHDTSQHWSSTKLWDTTVNCSKQEWKYDPILKFCPDLQLHSNNRRRGRMVFMRGVDDTVLIVFIVIKVFGTSLKPLMKFNLSSPWASHLPGFVIVRCVRRKNGDAYNGTHAHTHTHTHTHKNRLKRTETRTTTHTHTRTHRNAHIDVKRHMMKSWVTLQL